MGKKYNGKSKEEKAKEVDSLIEKANAGIENCFTSEEQIKDYLNFMSKLYNYSFRNTLLIKEQFKSARAVGSYAFWKEKGFTVNKGEKGIKILVPSKLSDYFINSKGEEVKVTKASQEEKRLINNKKIDVMKGKMVFSQGYVFEVTQTNAKAEDLPEIFPNTWIDGEVKNYELMNKAMENIAKKIGVKIIEPKEELGAVKGASYPFTKEVALNPRNTELQNVKTLVHELAHAKLHTMENRDNYTTNAKEFQAEMVAYTVCSYFGLEIAEHSFRYIKSWIKDVELKDKEKLINEVRETVKEYIEVIEETLINEKEIVKMNENILNEKDIPEIEVENNNLELKDIADNSIANDIDIHGLMKPGIINEKIEGIQERYNDWRFLVGRENWCKMELSGEGIKLKHIESENKEARKDFSKYAGLDNEIIADEMIKLENMYEEKLFKDLSNIENLEVGVYEVEKDKEYETLFDLVLKDGSFIKKGTSFIIDGVKDGKYEVHFSADLDNIYIPNDGNGDNYYFKEFEIEKFTDLSKGKVLGEVKENEIKENEIAEKSIEVLNFDIMKENVENLMNNNYGDFVKALIAIEKGINDLDVLDRKYEEYMDNDFNLINDNFEYIEKGNEQSITNEIEIGSADKTVEVIYSELGSFKAGEKLTYTETQERFKKEVEYGAIDKAVEFTFSLNSNLKYNEEFIIDRETNIYLSKYLEEKTSDDFYLNELVGEYLEDNGAERSNISSEKERDIKKDKSLELELE